MKFEPAIIPPVNPSSAWALLFRDDGTLALNADDSIPRQGPDEQSVYLGTLDGAPCFVARTDSREYCFNEIRGLHSQISDELYSLIGYASQILTWRENHRFCSRCGAATAPSDTERAMVCPACGHMSYPRVSPSMIVAVTKGDELLMARSPRFPPGLYSVLAGFLEPGETLEQCVAREVREETGIEIANIRYFASQPWPFPHSIMIGFKADYAGGEIRIDPSEIEDAGWYAPATLPDIPGHSTIARWLIDDYLKSRSDEAAGAPN
ncbi:NAD(+) diphosphatase [Pontiella sp.]|uniref:NAD(+) diphosphatase n=1 Tax=Pontiella sp. TaxID=2837462 RepID=UPI003569A408